MTVAAIKHTCSEIVYLRNPFGYVHGHGCSKPGKVERDGKWWCAIHDPVAIDTKAQKLKAWRDATTADARKRDHEAARDRALAAWAREWYAAAEASVIEGIEVDYREAVLDRLMAIMSPGWEAAHEPPS